MSDVRLATHLGDNADEIARTLSRSIESVTGFDVEVVTGAASHGGGRWSIEPAEIYWLCGLLTVELIAAGELDGSIVAAPVFPGRRQPVYSSVIVSPDATLTAPDVSDSTVAINETASWSGHHALRVHAQHHGWPPFRDIVTSGSHRASIEMLLSGDADLAAIDDTIWEHSLARDQRLGRLVVIDRTRPWPAPPFSLRNDLPPAVAVALHAALLDAVPVGLDRVVPTSNHDYEPMRTAMAAASPKG